MSKYTYRKIETSFTNPQADGRVKREWHKAKTIKKGTIIQIDTYDYVLQDDSTVKLSDYTNPRDPYPSLHKVSRTSELGVFIEEYSEKYEPTEAEIVEFEHTKDETVIALVELGLIGVKEVIAAQRYSELKWDKEVLERKAAS